jgi:glutathione synthase/RimK-type ligase-like ATP-grasp enzyme
MDIDAVAVDAFARDIFEKVSACDGFMWRYDPPAHPRLYAGRLMRAIEDGLHLPVFPSLASRWHFEDKIGQYYFLQAAGIATPATHIAWTLEQAQRFCKIASYPFVLKLATGYQGSNVRLVHNRNEGLFYAKQLFSHGVIALGYGPASQSRLLLRRARAAKDVFRGRNPRGPTREADLQYGYFLAQEFLPGNDFDVRVTITGDRAFVFRRFNRPGDFRASGSGQVDWNPSHVGEDAVRLAYQTARRLDSQTLTVDVLRRADEPVIVELGLAYASWAIRECPGHWVLHGEPDAGELQWVEGSIDPADAIFEDFVANVRKAA